MDRSVRATQGRQHWRIATVVLLAAACTAEDDDGPTPDAVAEHLAGLECEAWFTTQVCGEPRWPDEQACQGERAEQLREGYADAEARGRRYDASCAATLMVPEPVAPFEGCDAPCTVLSGDKGEGEACDGTGLGSDCAGMLECVGGECMPLVELLPRPLGATCIAEEGRPAMVCQTGLLCDDEGDGVCIMAPAEGETCVLVLGQPARCGTGYFCDLDAGTCHRTREVGEPCGSNGPSACETFNCVDGVCAAPDPDVSCDPLGISSNLGCKD